MLVAAVIRQDQWIYVFAPVAFYILVVCGLAIFGNHGHSRDAMEIVFRSISDSLRRLTGMAGWSMAGVLTGLWALGVAVVGLYWDVAFHYDAGRDDFLFTPSHTMILIGLGGIGFAAVIAVVFATMEQVDSGLRIGPLRIPWSAISLGAMGVGGVAGFPLDNLWHEAYGVDVTLWSPTHLQLVAGGSLATISLWLMILEGGPASPTLLGRGIRALAFGAILAGTSTFQGEFDFGGPQFQVLYLPLLIAAAAGFTLVAARAALGPWGAVKAVIAFLVLRGCVALLVGANLHHTVPRFPLYLAAALAVEAAARLLGTEPRLRFALVAGALVGTVGVAADLVYLGALAEVPPTTAGLPKAAVLAPLAAMAAALLGAALSNALPGGARLNPAAAVAGGLVLVAVLAVPLPRNVGRVDAVIRLRPVGDRALVDVQLSPPDAARRATAFGIMSWQGGGTLTAALREVGPGHYVSSRPVPVTGAWKSMIGLQRNDEVMAAPIYLPADPEIGASAVPALPERRVAFTRNTDVLLREAHPGPPWVAVSAYSGLAAVVLMWVGLFALCANRFRRDEEGRPREGQPREWQRPVAEPRTWAWSGQS